MLLLQASLILKILRGKYTAVTGYSSDLVDIVKRCLTQSATRRANTGGLHRQEAGSSSGLLMLLMTGSATAQGTGFHICMWPEGLMAHRAGARRPIPMRLHAAVHQPELMGMSLCAKQAVHSPGAVSCAKQAAFLRLKAVGRPPLMLCIHWACHAVHMYEAVTCRPAVPACCRAQASADGAVFCRQDQHGRHQPCIHT